jgi:pSer/pThr/pTyr-binding forkhead associated (FHA) protein
MNDYQHFCLVDSKGNVHLLSDTQITIGRVASNTIVLDDPKVSRHHCEMVYRDAAWYLRDIGALNSILVNKKELKSKSEYLLSVGDLIELGKTTLLFQLNSNSSVPSGFNNTVPAKITGTILGSLQEQLLQTPLPTAGKSTASVEASAKITPLVAAPAHAQITPSDAWGYMEERSTNARRYFFTKPVTLIGTSPRECDIVISDGSMDLKHAEVRFQKGVPKVYDLGSKNGTRLDKGRFVRVADLQDGCRITFGMSNFSFKLLPAGEELVRQARQEESVKKRRLLLIGGTVVFLVLGIGGAKVYLDQLESEKPAVVATSGNPTPSVSVPASTPVPTEPSFDAAFYERRIRKELESFATGSALRVAEQAREAAGTQEDQDRFLQIEKDLKIYQEMERDYGRRQYVAAWEKSQGISAGSVVYPSVEVIRKQSEDAATERVRILERELVKSETSGDWMKAEQLAKEYSELRILGYALEGAKVLKKVGIKRRLAEAFANESKFLDRDYKEIQLRLSSTLSRVKEESAKEPILDQSELNPELRALRDLRTHAELLTLFESFDGTVESLNTLTKLMLDPEQLSSAYTGREQITALLGIAKEIQFIRTQEYEALCAQYHEVQGNPMDAGKKITEILGTLDRMEEQMGSLSRMAVNSWLASQRNEWNRNYTNRLEELLAQAGQLRGRTDTSIGVSRVQNLLAEVEILQKLLLLYPAEVRQKGSNSQELEKVIGDFGRQKVFENSLRQYQQAVDQQIGIFHKAFHDGDMALNSIAKQTLEKLLELCLPEDQSSKTKIEAMLARY